ncbi:MAG: ATP-binding cassette domain-containing protein, partial [Burkholderiales bacterium]|nr:ATP-binding cassette domain-containing protein [Burkholderiales bacterium]
RFELAQRVAILGKGGSRKERLAAVLAGVKRPLSGNIMIGNVPLTELPETVTGRRIAYVSQEPRLRSGSLRDNLFYALKHRPTRAAEYDDEARRRHEQRLFEATRAGNSVHDINADWLDYDNAGVTGPEELTQRIVEVLRLVDMDEDVYQLGLKGAIDP